MQRYSVLEDDVAVFGHLVLHLCNLPCQAKHVLVLPQRYYECHRILVGVRDRDLEASDTEYFSALLGCSMDANSRFATTCDLNVAPPDSAPTCSHRFHHGFFPGEARCQSPFGLGEPEGMFPFVLGKAPLGKPRILGEEPSHPRHVGKIDTDSDDAQVWSFPRKDRTQCPVSSIGSG